MKVYDFIIVFKRPDYRWVNAISLLLLLLAIVFFVQQRKKKGYMLLYRLPLVIASLGWVYIPNGKLIALVYFLAALAEKSIIKFPQEVAFDEKGVVINSIPKKYFSWTSLANVILKDGILTIDFKNNKLIQKEIESYTSLQEEREFNEFCLSKLKADS